MQVQKPIGIKVWGIAILVFSGLSIYVYAPVVLKAIFTGEYGSIFGLISNMIIGFGCEIALLVGAEGVHLGQEDLPIREVKRIISSKLEGYRFVVGCSTHSIDQAVQAEEDGADYISFGPIFPTNTKPEYKSVGIKLLQQVKQKVRLPIVAIGGIKKTNIKEILNVGIDAIAVISAVSSEHSIEEVVRDLKSEISLTER